MDPRAESQNRTCQFADALRGVVHFSSGLGGKKSSFSRGGWRREQHLDDCPGKQETGFLKGKGKNGGGRKKVSEGKQS